MPNPGVGEDIEDVCSRCGDAWHVVMARVGERIAKVVCKRCGSQHNYRGGAAGVAAAAESAAAAATGGTGKRTPVRRATRSTAPVVVAAPPFDPSKPPRVYSPKDTYGTGERIEHPSFGTGVVAGTPGPGKVDVVFPAGLRTLACAKAESTLSRPEAKATNFYADRPPDKS